VAIRKTCSAVNSHCREILLTPLKHLLLCLHRKQSPYKDESNITV